MQSRLVSVSAIIVVAIAAGVRSQQKPSTQSQPETEEKPKLKHFGSSLDRLKWDDKKHAAVEKKVPPKNREEAEDVIRVETNLVVTDVQVRDIRGKIVTGLTKDDFKIIEDNQPQQIQHFSLGNDQSMGRTIVLLIDYSDSMSPYIKTSVEAAKMLVDQLGPKDSMAIVTDDVKLLVDFTRDKNKLKEGLDDLRRRVKWGQVGQSKQFTALLATAKELFNGEDMRRIIIFQTDGDEVNVLKNGAMDSATASMAIEQRAEWRARLPIREFSLADVYRAVEESRASVYTVIPSAHLITNSSGEVVQSSGRFHPEWYQAAAGAAIGGWATYLRRPEEALEIYSRILADINSRYVIGYYPTNKQHDGSRRKVVITVLGHPDYAVAGRKSYVAVGP